MLEWNVLEVIPLWEPLSWALPRTQPVGPIRHRVKSPWAGAGTSSFRSMLYLPTLSVDFLGILLFSDCHHLFFCGAASRCCRRGQGKGKTPNLSSGERCLRIAAGTRGREVTGFLKSLLSLDVSHFECNLRLPLGKSFYLYFISNTFS